VPDRQWKISLYHAGPLSSGLARKGTATSHARSACRRYHRGAKAHDDVRSRHGQCASLFCAPRRSSWRLGVIHDRGPVKGLWDGSCGGRAAERPLSYGAGSTRDTRRRSKTDRCGAECDRREGPQGRERRHEIADTTRQSEPYSEQWRKPLNSIAGRDLHRGNDIPQPRDRTPKIAEAVSAETETQP